MSITGKDHSLWIIDSTMRERSMMKGRDYTEAEKLKLAKLLSLAGVQEIEAGIPTKGPQECRAIRKMKIENPNTLITCWVKASMDSIELARRCSVNSIHICFPEEIIAPSTTSAHFEKSLVEMKQMIRECFKNFDYVSVGIANPFSGDAVRLNRFIALAVHEGVVRVRLSDSGLSLKPEIVGQFFDTLTTQTSASLEFHGHNAYKTGLENTLSAIRNGADAISVTLSGIGINGGVAALEEIGPALLSEFEYTALNFYKLNEAAKMVNTLENRRKPRKVSSAA